MDEPMKYSVDFIVERFMEEAIKYAESSPQTTGTTKIAFPLQVTNDDESDYAYYSYVVLVPKIEGVIGIPSAKFIELTEDEYLDQHLDIINAEEKINFNLEEEDTDKADGE